MMKKIEQLPTFETERLIGRELLRFSFAKLEANRVSAICDVRNLAAERVMQKVGTSFEGIMRQHVFCKGSYHDIKVYAILQEEWQQSRR